MNVDCTQHRSDWRNRPLCGNYLAVLLHEQPTLTGIAGQTASLTIQWALGATHDGQCEVLGWWSDPSGCAVGWSAVSADLSARGVERIRVLVGPHGNDKLGLAREGEECHTAASTLQPSSSVEDLPARQQRHVMRASEMARGAQLALARAIAKQGTFACPAAAMSFVDEKLQRLDRRLWSDAAHLPAQTGQLRKPVPAIQLLLT